MKKAERAETNFLLHRIVRIDSWIGFQYILSGIIKSGRLETMEDTYFIGWGTLALINAGLAQGKNHSGFKLFLSPPPSYFIVEKH